MTINEEYTLADLVKRGGICTHIEGTNKNEIISNIIDSLPNEILTNEKHNDLIKAVMEREALMSTGIENGIALPHPRTPLLKEGEKPFVAIAFPNEPVNWGTPDNTLVHTVFLIVSESPKQHLNALTKINFMCMNKNFYELIAAQTSKEEIIVTIEEAEKAWRK